MRRRLAHRWLLAVGCIAACSPLPAEHYGVESVRFVGMKQMSAEALAACLTTQERAHVELGLEVASVRCGSPPFDRDWPRLRLWSWPWTAWPTLDRIALERDQKRVERWYQARGFHAAKVIDVQVDPPSAAEKDTVAAAGESPDCERHAIGQGCVAEVVFVIEEGEPTLVADMQIAGIDELPPDLAAEIRAAVPLQPSARFDEATYDDGKEQIKQVLGRHSFARARVEGTVRIDRPQRRAWITYEVAAGPPCVFGDVIVQGEAYYNPATIAGAVLVARGAPYDFAALIDAQQAVYALGVFAAVTVEPVLPDAGNVVDIRVRVTPASLQSGGFGVGIQAGELQTQTQNISAPEWDVHLLARYRHNNLLGGMRQLTLEERPRAIVLQRFPMSGTPRFGNTAVAELRQPGFLEPRVLANAKMSYALGPDPFDTFFRHQLDSELGTQRLFLLGVFSARLALHNSIYRVPAGERRFDGSSPPASSLLTFAEETLRVDLTHTFLQPVQSSALEAPRRGITLQLSLHEAGHGLPSDWDFVRFMPDARGYLPLFSHVSLAVRFALGFLFVTRASPALDELSRALGPRDDRLRGGGATSNRGFLPGTLGDGIEGGVRRWEASVELRVPLGSDIGLVGFCDAGDVNRAPRFRFDYPQAAAGFGLRYYTLIGPIRLDLAWKLPGLQVLARTDERVPPAAASGSQGSRGGPFVTNLTIGEAF